MNIPEDYEPMDFVLAVEKRWADKQKDLKQQVKESSDTSQDAAFALAEALKGNKEE